MEEFELEVSLASAEMNVEVAIQSEAFDLEIEMNSVINMVMGMDPILIVVAQEDVQAYQPVTATGYVADSNNTAHRNKVVGIAKAAIAATFSGEVQPEGELTNPGWNWNIGDLIFINGLGILSTTSPDGAWSQQIGIATGETSISIEIQEAIRL